MANISVYNQTGKVVGNMELSDSIFNIDINEHVVKMSVVQYLANQRQGTKSLKTRAEVRGGGRKPWKQKGTGRARQGSIRSTQWRGGGVVFAAKPRDFSFKLNKKVKRLALKSVLTSKLKSDKLIILDDLRFDNIKTKYMKNVIDSLKLSRALFVIEGADNNVILSARNIRNIKTSSPNTINVYDILNYEHFVVTKEAVNRMQEVYV